jgi:hypothetical protein
MRCIIPQDYPEIKWLLIMARKVHAFSELSLRSMKQKEGGC